MDSGLQKGFNQSIYLPSVWEYYHQTDLFLDELCIKADLMKDCWQDPMTALLRFHADVFSESTDE